MYDQARPLIGLRGVHRALKPDGVYLMQDISGTSHVHRDVSHPLGTFLYTISCMLCMPGPLWRAGHGAGASGSGGSAIVALHSRLPSFPPLR